MAEIGATLPSIGVRRRSLIHPKRTPSTGIRLRSEALPIEPLSGMDLESMPADFYLGVGQMVKGYRWDAIPWESSSKPCCSQFFALGRVPTGCRSVMTSVNGWGGPFRSGLSTAHWSVWKQKGLFLPGRVERLPNAGIEQSGSTA